jgi:hypothetical protein
MTNVPIAKVDELIEKCGGIDWDKVAEAGFPPARKFKGDPR